MDGRRNGNPNPSASSSSSMMQPYYSDLTPPHYNSATPRAYADAWSAQQYDYNSSYYPNGTADYRRSYANFDTYVNGDTPKPQPGHPNELPGYNHPRTRYPGEIKTEPSGEMMPPYQPQYYANNYNYGYNPPQAYEPPAYRSVPVPTSRPFDPYYAYDNNPSYDYNQDVKLEVLEPRKPDPPEKDTFPESNFNINFTQQTKPEEPNNNEKTEPFVPVVASASPKPEKPPDPVQLPDVKSPKKKRKKSKKEKDIPKVKEESPPLKVEEHSEEEDEETDASKKDVPMVECGCFPADEVHAEPGPFYTQLGAATTLADLREQIEHRTGFKGAQLRFEKVIYTGKEGKTSHGCPLSKWIIRRGSYEEQLLFLVKHRKGHKCSTAWIVICCVIWEGVPPHFSDNIYDTLVYKLNRFGIPTTRRSDTNEQRSCACQGVDPDTCGAAYSFGCAWSMFFNGCKYARSRNVRKFRLTEEHEESEMEEKLQHLATHLGPLYDRVAPDSFRNQVDHENEGLECRLGYRPGRPFSGVTVCMDYCSHAHKDAHNMTNGCTVTVSFTRNRTISKGDDEQYHVFPLYKLDDTDEHGSKEAQKQKVKKGQLEILKKFPCKVRIRKVPLLPSRRRGKTKAPAKSEPATPQKTEFPDPPPKKEKPSVFSEHINGSNSSSAEPFPQEQSSNRFQAYPPAPPHTNTETPGWNQYGNAATPPSQGSNSSTSSSSPFRAYFDQNAPSTPYTPVASVGSSSSLSSLTELTNSTSRNSSGASILSSSGSPRDAPSSGSSGYTSMSPILPSFRHTFMTEGETMMSSMSSPAESTSSPRPTQPQYNSKSSSSSSSSSSSTQAAAFGSISEQSYSPSFNYNPSPSTSTSSIGPPPNAMHYPATFPPNYNPQFAQSDPHYMPHHTWNPTYAPPPYNAYGVPPNYHAMNYPAYHNNGSNWTPPHHHFPPGNITLPPHQPPPPSCFVTPPKPKVIPEVNETFSDNEEAFKDSQIGGVAIALTHGSVILQCAKHELHATTALKNPNRLYPSRICLIFYQHKSMNNRFHGWSEWEKKIEAKKLQEVKLINQGKMEASPRKMKQLIKEGYLQDHA